MPLLTPFTVTHSDRVSALIVHQREENKYSEKWICFTKCSVGLQTLLNKFKNVFVCFRVLNLLLWDYLCMCMKSCLVNSSFWSAGHTKINGNEWCFCPVLLYLQMKRWGDKGIMRAVVIIPDPSHNTLTTQAISKEKHNCICLKCNWELIIVLVHFYVLLLIAAQTYKKVSACAFTYIKGVLLCFFTFSASMCNVAVPGNAVHFLPGSIFHNIPHLK